MARAVDFLQSDQQLAADDLAADVAAGDVGVDRVGALVDVDRMRRGQNVAQRERHVGLALFDQHRGCRTERLAGGQLGDVSEGGDDIAQIVAGAGMDMGRVRRIVVLGPHRGDAGDERERGKPTNRATAVPQLLERGMRVMALWTPPRNPVPKPGHRAPTRDERMYHDKATRRSRSSTRHSAETGRLELA